MTICLGKSCSFALPCMSFVNIYQYACVLLCLLVLGDEMWESIVLVLDYCIHLFTLKSDFMLQSLWIF